MRATIRFIVPLLIAFACLACGAVKVTPQSASSNELREVRRAYDMNSDPTVVEVELIAAPAHHEFVSGRQTEVWAFNGQLPGPLIEANVGDTVVVHFRNLLPEATTIHWHGIRLTPQMDGSHVSQQPVQPGDSFEYRFVVPDPGLYWYHPHHNGSTQVAMGMYGPLLVRGAEEPQSGIERILVLSDALLDDTWEMIPPAAVALSPIDHAIGVHGNRLLVNGQLKPKLTMQPNSRERWRIVNASTSRYYRLAFDGATMHQLGGDSGFADLPLEREELILAVGERADIVVTPAANRITLHSLPNKRIYGYQFEAGHEEPLLEIAAVGAPLAELPPLPTLPGFTVPGPPVAERGIQFAAAIDPFLDTVLPRSRSCLDASCDLPAHGVNSEDSPHMSGSGEFYINGFRFPDVPVIQARLGTTEVWSVNNHTEMDHPFHLHGFRFLVLDEDGIAPAQRMWKDTINIKGSRTGEHTVRLLVDFSGHPGRWVYHCHILHHQEHGMMAELDVVE